MQPANDPEYPWKEAFAILDKNGDGSITHDELRVIFEALGSKATDEDIAKYIGFVDTNKSGKVEYEEFRDLMNKKVKLDEPLDVLVQAFKVLDVNSTGKVNVDELRYVLTGIGNDKLTDEEVDEILKDAPVADGNLEYEPFLHSMIAQ